MNSPHASAEGGAVRDLPARWRVASLAAGWLRPDDWHCVAVDVMAHAVVEAEGESSAAALLGADRAARGVGLAESLTDLDALYWAAAETEPPFPVTRAFAESWSDVTTSSLLTRGATDALTGLGTADYLATRIREVYAEERATGIPTPEAWRAIRIAASPGGGWDGALGRLARARVVASVLDRGESSAVLPTGTVLSLARAPSIPELVARLRHRLGAAGDSDSLVSALALPATREAALESLLAL